MRKGDNEYFQILHFCDRLFASSHFFFYFCIVIELDRHIEILLLSNDCVIVPGLGGFMAHHVDARRDERDGSLLPPLRDIGFNSKLTLNDSLLAQSYVEAYDLSYPDAVKRIEDEVRELRQHLEKKGHFELNDIGTVSLNDDGHLEFEPCIAGLLTPELYGLSNVEIMTLAELERASSAAPQADTSAPHLASIAHALPAMAEESETEPSETTTSAPVAASSTPAESSAGQGVSDTAPSATSSAAFSGAQTADNTTGEEPSTADQTDAHSARIVALWRSVAVVAIALLAFLLIPTPLANNGPMVMESRIDTGLLQRIMPTAEVAMPKAATPMPKAAAPALKAPAATPKTTAPTTKIDAEKPTPTVDHAFCIVLASRVSKKNATRYTADLQHRGYKSARILNRVNGAKVVYGNFKTQDEAQQVLRQLNDKEEFAEAWVMKY